MTDFFAFSDDDILVFLRVTPNAGRERIDGVETRADRDVLRVRVAAVPDKGKANAAVLALLACALGLPKSALTLVSGETARAKTVRIAAADGALPDRLQALRAGWP